MMNVMNRMEMAGLMIGRLKAPVLFFTFLNVCMVWVLCKFKSSGWHTRRMCRNDQLLRGRSVVEWLHAESRFESAAKSTVVLKATGP